MQVRFAIVGFLLGVVATLGIGCESSSLTGTCGNGTVGPGETCDPQSSVAPCLTAAQCDDGDPCTTDTYSGSPATCDVVCTHTAITGPVAGDGCCPAGADQTTDSDCASVCGNGVLESGELCDIGIAAGQPGACPASAQCDDGVACTRDALVGTGCQAQCTHAPITAAGAPDGCCPAGATSATDPDCSPSCGNGVLDPGETCDTGITSGDGACPTTCDDGDPCTVDTLISGGTCHAACQHTAITTLVDGDGCCPPTGNHNTDVDCAASCGNGAVEAGEQCDVGIAAGLAGACPIACDDGNACTTDALTGAGCAAHCVFAPVTAPANGDGCCPPGANAANDTDCPVVCGNGAVEQGETCDTAIASGAGKCVAAADCDDGNPCTTDSLVFGGTCKAQCQHTLITALVDGDGCCPAGGNANTDADCQPFCGNGVVETGEACDIAVPAGVAGACPTSVAACDDGNTCTVDTLVGSYCNARCERTVITAVGAADQCCPAGGNANNDPDCLAICGNGVLEAAAGEACDIAIAAGSQGACPTSCDDHEVCTVDTLLAAGCGTRCQFTPITACSMTSDGCCPPGCNHNTDADCSASCGNGALESGETCDPGIAAGSTGACPTSCDDGDGCTADSLVGEALNCTAHCSNVALTPNLTATDGCCKTGVSGWNANTDADCPAVCGNGVWEAATEQCDTAITTGAGKCPSAADCVDTDTCTLDHVVGTGCGQHCAHDAITTCSLTADGCCPSGCNANSDADCSPVCGNGVVESGEECDKGIAAGQPGACPTVCNDGDICTSDTLSGSAANCTARCAFTPKVPNLAATDGCCKSGQAGWNANTDADCPAVCGNGVWEAGAGEACDTAISIGPGACPTACDDGNACTTDTLQGAGTCAAACSFSPITPCCGNGVVETGETCDTAIGSGPGKCPTSCSDGDACTTDALLNPGTCTAACSYTPITPCCGNGIVESNETCDTAIPSGSAGSCADITCNDGSACTIDTAVGTGTCNKLCTHTPVFTSGDGCCPPTGRHSDDSDCLCGNGTTDAASFEQCDDGDATNTNACTNSCTLGGMVGAPCADASACALNAQIPVPSSGEMEYCVTTELPGVVNGYCTVALCDTTDTTTMVTSCPQPLGASNPTSLCVPFNSTLGQISACVALCNPVHGDADCRQKEANALGAPAYMCTQVAAGVFACLPRPPTL